MAKTVQPDRPVGARIGVQTPPLRAYPTIAGMSDRAVQNKTGMTWPQWCATLDAVGAQALGHPDIVRHIRSQHPHVSAWWAQSVTVGYERIRGLRETGQRRNNQTFAANKSRTFPVPVAALYRACSEQRMRAQWMKAAAKVRSAKPKQSIRFDWPDGTLVAVTFIDKGPHKSVIAVQHQGLADQQRRAEEKQAWGARLDTLAGLLGGSC